MKKPAANLDTFDRKLLNLLQRRGRASYVEMAEAVNLSESACLRRVKVLEETGVIGRYAAVIDERAVGLPLSVFVTVTLSSQAEATLSAFEKAIANVREVAECYLMTGGSDYLLRLVVADVDDLERVHAQELTRIPGVVRVRARRSPCGRWSSGSNCRSEARGARLYGARSARRRCGEVNLPLPGL